MRRKTLVSASASAGAAALALGALLSGCGGSGRDAYVATGAAGPGSSRSVDGTVPPKGGVELIPLGGESAPSSAPPSPKAPPSFKAPPSPASPPTTSVGPSPRAATRGPSPSRPTPAPSRPSTPAPLPSSPADLRVGDPHREPDPDGRRWCEKVTVTFTNPTGPPITAGTVTFGTHVIDALGFDWATLPSTRSLPAPILAGREAEGSWVVCVDEWRVPLGMRVETRVAAATWS
ncbi:hypothetical protein AB0H17_27455 [Streptomyces olivoreticuli]